MAVAAASLRSLLHALPSTNINSNNSLIRISPHSSLLLNPLEPKTLNLNVTLRPPFAPLSSRVFSSSSFSAYAETDEENFDDEGREQEEEEEGEGEEEGEIESGKLREVSSSNKEEGRLYVGNLPYSMTSSELAEIFGQAGTVESAEIVYDRVTDRSRGFAFVTMASNDDAKAAIRMFNGTQVGGRTVKVNFPEVPRGGEREVLGPRARSNSRGYMDSPYKIYAGNLGWSVTSDSLKEAFSDQPGVLGAKVIYEQFSGRSRGFGFVTFVSEEDVQNAMEAMNGKEVQGRPLRLNLASQRASNTAATDRVKDIVI
ncbi:RNA-binding protein CP33, chloroplastic [Asparagus officinalis]|uniref:RNA-binding protein CP33, chloroplastic n=1 Tax=Asparagus officinalis TaxID=4686 RepID=UPI00098E5924|nr:RNA-binding protein CP33, chloroplastic [Asparagus officinalis]